MAHSEFEHREQPPYLERSPLSTPGLGVAYYPEYARTVDLDRDFALMTAAGVTVIRVGESTWSDWEPREGAFRSDWMREVLDAAHRHGLGAILGTPTYAVPPWLARLDPDMVGVDRDGRPIGWGGRQEMDLTSPTYRRHAASITALVVEAFRDHPAVVGYQVDNEPGAQLLYNDRIVDRFRGWIAEHFDTVDAVNREWGLSYWSHRLTDFDELWRPESNRQPQYDFAWRLFQAEIVDDFMREMTDVTRDRARSGQFVTTCVAHDRPGADDWAIGGSVDVAASNSYYRMQDCLAHPSALRPQTWMTDGAWSVALTADRVFAAKNSPFLITETNAGPINDAEIEEPGWDGQWRQVGWLMFLRGARLTGYWHWRTTAAGTEEHWGGILPHDGEPGRVYANIAALGADIARASDRLAVSRPDADTGILFSTASKFALAHQSVFPDEQGVDGRSYLRIVESFARAAFTSGRQTRVIHDRSLVDQPLDPVALPVLIAAGLFVAEDSTLDALRRYAEDGGHLVIGPRTAVAGGWAVIREDRKPARLAAAAGVGYQEYSTLSAPVRVQGHGPLQHLTGQATDWIDMLEPDGAEVLATYDHPGFGASAAVTSRVVGRGRITVVGTLLDDDAYRALFAWIDSVNSVQRAPLPETVTHSSATAEDGSSRLHAWFNWSWEPTRVDVPPAWEVLAGDPTGELGAWDVCVAVEPLPPVSGSSITS